MHVSDAGVFKILLKKGIVHQGALTHSFCGLQTFGSAFERHHA